VFILVDDLGWRDVGAFGSTFYETPNIDELASDGVRFTNAYAAAPICSPTRLSIMTGKYPARLNGTDWFGAPQPDDPYPMWWVNRYRRDELPLTTAEYTERMPLEEVTLAEALKDAGYSTFFAGKWHLGPEGYWPENQGFDVNKGGYTAGGPHSYFSPYKNPRLEDGPKGEQLPHRLAEETVKFIKNHKDQPFLAYLSFYSVHVPLQARKDLIQKYEKKKKEEGLEPRMGREDWREVRLNQTHPVYAGMVDAMDQAVGMVLGSLKDAGLDSNTIIFFMSDNGGLSTVNGYPTSNAPLRDGKGWLYEGGIREPMIIKWPGVTQAGTTNGTPVISTDFYPTILDMAELPPKSEQARDGVSLVPLLKGKKLDRKRIYWHFPHYSPQGGFPGSAVRQGKWKLIHNYETNRLQLYNLLDDISEAHNLVEQYPDTARILFQHLDKWRNDVGARMPIPINKDLKK